MGRERIDENGLASAEACFASWRAAHWLRAEGKGEGEAQAASPYNYSTRRRPLAAVLMFLLVQLRTAPRVGVLLQLASSSNEGSNVKV